MTGKTTDQFSAGEQGKGYIYQARLALRQLLQLPVKNKNRRQNMILKSEMECSRYFPYYFCPLLFLRRDGFC
jgi:hypothetical protein